MKYNYIFGLNFLKNKVFLEEEICKLISTGDASYICVVDGNALAWSNRDVSYQRILRNSAFCTCDGVSVRMLSRLFFSSIDLITGPEIIAQLLSTRYRHMLVGTEDKLRSNLGKLLKNKSGILLDFYDLPHVDANTYNYSNLSNKINVGRYDIIWISLGAPKQDIFAANLSSHLSHGLIIGVGAGFDLLNSDNNVARMAKSLGLLWVWRIFKEPKRLGGRALRYLSIIPSLLTKEFYNRIKNKDG